MDKGFMECHGGVLWRGKTDWSLRKSNHRANENRRESVRIRTVTRSFVDLRGIFYRSVGKDVPSGLWTGPVCRSIVEPMIIRIIASTALASAVLFMALDAAAATLVGHRADYAVHLSATASDSAVARAEGEVRYNFAAACKGWTVENRTRLAFGLTNGGNVGHRMAVRRL